MRMCVYFKLGKIPHKKEGCARIITKGRLPVKKKSDQGIAAPTAQQSNASSFCYLSYFFKLTQLPPFTTV